MLITIVILFIAYCVWLYLKYQALNEAERQLHKLTQEILGDEGLSNLKEKRIWRGMPECLICCSSYGEPEHAIRSVGETDVYETWFYEGNGYKYQQPSRRYDFEIHIKNQYVTGWKQNR